MLGEAFAQEARARPARLRDEAHPARVRGDQRALGGGQRDVHLARVPALVSTVSGPAIADRDLREADQVLDVAPRLGERDRSPAEVRAARGRPPPRRAPVAGRRASRRGRRRGRAADAAGIGARAAWRSTADTSRAARDVPGGGADRAPPPTPGDCMAQRPVAAGSSSSRGRRRGPGRRDVRARARFGASSPCARAAIWLSGGPFPAARQAPPPTARS